MKEETDMTDKASMPSIERYRLAVVEFRLARAELAAEDHRLGRSGFGATPSIVELRHTLANPDESGSFGDDISKIKETTT